MSLGTISPSENFANFALPKAQSATCPKQNTKQVHKKEQPHCRQKMTLQVLGPYKDMLMPNHIQNLMRM